MAKRFDDLEDVYTTLTAINFDFNQLPATNKYRKYKEWKQDPDKRKRTNVPNSGRKAQMGVIAFGYPATDDDNKLIVRVGARARTHWNSLDAALKAAVPLNDDPDGTFSVVNGFITKYGSAKTPIFQVGDEARLGIFKCREHRLMETH